MKKVSLGEYLLYFLVKGFGFIVRLLPIDVALFIGRRFGQIAMIFNSKRYRIAYANIKASLGDEYPPCMIKRIIKRTYANIGQGLIELLWMPRMDMAYVNRYIRFEDFHIAEDLLKQGRGLIFLTAHFGPWEMANVGLPLKGYQYKAIAREQKPYLINQLLNRYRESKGCKIISKGLGIKEIIRTLRSNGIVGMLVDQDAGKTGVFVKLFGRDASWHRGVMEFAIATKATIIPGFVIREKGPYLRFKLCKAIVLPTHGPKEDIIREGFRQYVSVLEDNIRQAPDHWLWQHRRWKSTPARDILILDDGKTGHLRQSQAVVYAIQQIWQERGYSQDDIRIKTVEVSFKRRWAGVFLKLGSNLSSPFCCGCLKCLSFSLSDESYRSLQKSYADIVISCGSSTAAVNLILSKENNAKSIVIMRPALIDVSRFNLAIIPRHDNPPARKNVVVTDGALNLINKRAMAQMAELLRQRIQGNLRFRVIGMLIGGEAAGFTLDRERMRRLLDELVKASYQHDADILITTSRRTSYTIEELMRERLENEQRCRLLVIANEANIHGVVEGILGLATVVLVSPESISMVSEAASSGAHTLVFAERRLRNKRHQAFLDYLNQNGLIQLIDYGKVSSGITQIFLAAVPKPCLDDSSKITEALQRLL